MLSLSSVDISRATATSTDGQHSTRRYTTLDQDSSREKHFGNVIEQDLSRRMERRIAQVDERLSPPIGRLEIFSCSEILLDNNAVASVVGGIMSHDIVKVGLERSSLLVRSTNVGCFRSFPNRNPKTISSSSMESPAWAYRCPLPVELSPVLCSYSSSCYNKMSSDAKRDSLAAWMAK